MGKDDWLKSMRDWYDIIEPGIRPIVKLLRDNGINTMSSCEHAMIVEAAWDDDDAPARAFAILAERGYVFEITCYWSKSACSSGRRLEVRIQGQNPCPFSMATPLSELCEKCPFADCIWHSRVSVPALEEGDDARSL